MVYVPQNDLIIFSDNQLFKHLGGQHDQTAHGRKGPIEAGYDNWYGNVEKLAKSAQTIDKSRGNRYQAVVLEAAGFNGKPEMVDSIDESKALYRGVGQVEQVQDFKEAEVQFAGEGIYGNGTYFSNNFETAASYAGSRFQAPTLENKQDKMLFAEWKPDAKTITFESIDEAFNYGAEQHKIFFEGLKNKLGDSMTSDTVSALNKLTNGGNFSSYLIMGGYDGYIVKTGATGEAQYHTVVLNRGALKVKK